ncbi:MAG: molybdopterin molybdotransferase MoeA, partial [Actinomycetota bacterium]
EEARRRILDAVTPLPPKQMPLVEANGCVLAQQMAVKHDLPYFASSAMDGFAVRSSDVSPAKPPSPVGLLIVGRAAVGRYPRVSVGPGEAVQIATGAPIPKGADCIVPIEDCLVEGAAVLVSRSLEPGEFVRPAGQDLRAGEVIVPAGRVLGGPELGIIAAAGYASVAAHPKARVAVVSTGDELVEPGRRGRYGSIPDSNSYLLAGALQEAGAVALRVGIVPDDEAALERAIRENLARADCLITSGGVSVGERDVVRNVLGSLGDVESYRVAVQPGMPQAFGLLKGKPFFGLPGNPVSVFCSFEMLVRPGLLKMMGRRDLDRPEIAAVLHEPVAGLAEKTRLVGVELSYRDGVCSARPTGPPASNLLGTLVRAHGLGMIPAGQLRARAGERVRIRVFRQA